LRTLHLLRHAKSSWDEPGLDDHDRPLAKRGRTAARALAAHLATLGLAPELVLCSTAARARQTLDLLMPPLRPGKVILDRAIYDAGERRLLKYLRALDDAVGSVLLIGHNPALQDLACALVDPDSARGLPPLQGKFPTGAFASFGFKTGWAALAPQGAVLLGYVAPRDLPPAG
jgi:phosphohistidine phosphatase